MKEKAEAVMMDWCKSIGPRCAWWSEKYGMCYVEMIMLRA